jgi:hypothetical protein
MVVKFCANVSAKRTEHNGSGLPPGTELRDFGCFSPTGVKQDSASEDSRPMRLTSLILFILLLPNQLEAQIPRWTAIRALPMKGLSYGFGVVKGTNVVEARYVGMTSPPVYVGDVITSVRGVKVFNEESLFTAMNAVKQSTFKITVNRPLRDGGQKQLAVTVFRSSREVALNAKVFQGTTERPSDIFDGDTGGIGEIRIGAVVVGKTESIHDRFGNSLFVFNVPPLPVELKRKDKRKWEFYERLRPFVFKDYRPNVVERISPLLSRSPLPLPQSARKSSRSGAGPLIYCEIPPDEWKKGTRVQIESAPCLREDPMPVFIDGKQTTVDVFSLYHPGEDNELALPNPDDK